MWGGILLVFSSACIPTSSGQPSTKLILNMLSPIKFIRHIRILMPKYDQPDISTVVEILLKDGKYPFMLQDECRQSANVEKANGYVLFSYGDNVTQLVDNFNIQLDGLSCNSTGNDWSPSEKCIGIISSKVPNEHFDRLSRSLYRLLWERRIYNSAIIISQPDSKDGHILLADPFDVGNECGKNPNLIKTVEHNLGMEVYEMLTFTNRKIFPNCNLIVTARHSPPFSIKTETGFEGIESDFIKLFTETHGLNYSWVDRPDPESGQPMEVVHAYYQNLSRNELDIAIGGPVLSLGRANIEYLTSHKHHLIYFYIDETKNLKGWKVLIHMFSLEIWVILFFTLFVCSLVLNRFVRTKQINSSAGNSYLLVFGIITQQCISATSNLVELKVLIGMLLLCFYSVSALYCTFLQSYTVRPPLKHTVSTVDELFKANYQVLASDTNVKLLKNVIGDQQSLIDIETSVNFSIPSSLRKLKYSNKLAILERDGPMLYYILTSYKSKVKRIGPLTSMISSMPIPKGSLYEIRLNQYITWSVEHGLFEFWTKKLTQLELFQASKRMNISKFNQPLKLTNVEGAFMLLLIGHFISFVIFCVEFIIFKRINKFRRNGYRRQTESSRTFSTNNST